jgi:hypothetical protein
MPLFPVIQQRQKGVSRRLFLLFAAERQRHKTIRREAVA